MQNLLLEIRHPQKRKLSLRFAFFSTVTLQFLFLTLFPQPKTFANNTCQPSIERTIEAIINQPHLQRTRWGIDIQQVSITSQTSTPLFTHNSKQFFLPASTAKLFTTTALAKVFGHNYQIETAYLGQGTAPHLKQLRIVGRGDPSILDPQLTQLAQSLKNQGIESIETLVADNQLFGSPQIIPSWEWADLQTSDGVPVTSLSFSQNSLPLQLSPQKVGQPLQIEWLDGKPLAPLIIENLSTTVEPGQPEYIRLERNLAGTTLTIHGQLQAGANPDLSYVAIAFPSRYFLHRLKQAFQTEGIHVKNLDIEPSSAASLQDKSMPERTLGTLKSPPLTELLSTINQSSNNFYTESLLRHLAWFLSSQENVTPEFSLKTLKDTLQTEGIEPDGFFLKDASGLSRQNLVSPESLTNLLTAVLQWQGTEKSEKFQILKESLAIAGQTGTLKRRFQGSPVEGKLAAKTGTLSGTVTLAGFLEGEKGSTIVLSLMANHSDQPISVLRQAIDDIVLKIAQSQSCRDMTTEKQTNSKKSLYNLKS